MTINPQIVHICDHIIESIDKEIGTLEITHTPGSLDDLGSDIVLQEVYNAYSQSDSEEELQVFYYLNADFRIKSGRFVEWIGNNEPAGKYYLECYSVKSHIEQYEPEDCPRCMSNGWYVDLFPQTESEVAPVSGLSKIIQDFIKIIFTYRLDDDSSESGDGYGTKLADYIGEVITDPNQICSEIATIFYNAAEQYKNMQTTSMLDENALSDEELLDRIVIDSIEYEEKSGGVYLEVTIYSQSGTETDIGISL